MSLGLARSLYNEGCFCLQIDGTGVGVGQNLLLRKHRKPAAPPAHDAAGVALWSHHAGTFVPCEHDNF